MNARGGGGGGGGRVDTNGYHLRVYVEYSICQHLKRRHPIISLSSVVCNILSSM